MKQDYTLDELQTEMTALAQLFDSVTLADPRMGLLDPATLQPLNKVAAMPALDAAGRGLKIEKAADGLRTVIAQGITVADTPCVLLLGMPLPRNLQADGAEDAFTRALSQMQDDLRRDYVTGVYNSVYLNEAFRPRAERAALDGKPVGVVMVRVNEYWQLREKESDSAADCCLNMASGILQLVVGPDHDKAVLARLNDGYFAIVTVGTPAARMSVSMGIRTRTMMDKSTRNLATMLAEGSGQGVLDCKRAERDYPEASPGAFKLCHELGAFQSDAEETWRGVV